ncbi:MAG: hypothetical protein WBW48_11170 [Anaerolineae bacterium]
MSIKKALIPVLACALLLCACGYIVLPEEEEGASTSAGSKGWSAVATNIGKSAAGDLHIDLTIRNETGDWSAMQATAGKPAVFTAGGKTTNCDTVFVSTGGHRLAPGFQMRGYIAGTKAEPKTQLIYVECKGAEAAPGSKLSVNYSYVTGQYNYYEPEANKADGRLEINLDQVATDLKYPIASPVEGLIQKPDTQITALNDCVLTLTGVTRTDKGMQFKWLNSNPGEYPTYVHIGNPPVIGADGIIYGRYETPDLASVPITPAGGTAEWTTEVAVPKDVKGLYILLSVESGKQRLYANYAVDVTDK